jgi:hypothetical protein
MFHSFMRNATEQASAASRIGVALTMASESTLTLEGCLRGGYRAERARLPPDDDAAHDQRHEYGASDIAAGYAGGQQPRSMRMRYEDAVGARLPTQPWTALLPVDLLQGRPAS